MISGLLNPTPALPHERCSGALQSVLTLFKSAGITRRLKKLDVISKAREYSNTHKSTKAYSARPFILCGIPFRRPAKHSHEYSRQIGRFRLRVIGHPDYYLPFSQDRLLLIWIATMATWQKSRVIHFRSATAILETFGLPKDGRYYKRLVAGFERIFYSTFYFASHQQDGDAVLIERQSFRFVKDARLWYSKSQSSQTPQAKGENVIVLSEEFWKEIQEHPIPVYLAVVKALADSPSNLDLYVWLAWRCWTAKGNVCVPLFGPEGLISQLGISERLRQWDFRRQIVRWLNAIHQLCPECPAILTETKAYLLLRPAGKGQKIPTTQREFAPDMYMTEFALIRDSVRGGT